MSYISLFGLDVDDTPVWEFLAEISQNYLLLADDKYRIIYANKALLHFFGVDTVDEVKGKNFGMACGCTLAAQCGVSAPHATPCSACGLMCSLRDLKLDEIRVIEFATPTEMGQQPILLRCKTKRLKLDGREVYALSLQDITDSKRRETLERMFYHDLLNAASGITGLLDVIKMDMDDNEATEALKMLGTARKCAEYLVDEIVFSRSLAAAENGSLDLNVESVKVNGILEKAVGLFSLYQEEGRIRIRVDGCPTDTAILSDKSLLVRILVNLIKNAMEASSKGAPVTVSVNRSPAGFLFEVHNDSVMSKKIQENIFVRAYSTKGKGRGIGTYSAKMFTEKYLKGKIWFESREDFGTSFYVEVPSVSI